MIVVACQRWRSRRDSYRPAGEPIRTADYEVHASSSDTEARAFVQRHHYSGSYPAARMRLCLRRRGELVGVAVLSQPPSQAALDKALPFPGERAELGRFVLLDDVPANGESWFLARAFELARREGFEAIVAHSDPEPRLAPGGAAVFGGHVGTIYQATNARYVGKTNASTVRLFADGTVFSNRTWGKLRLRHRGYLAAVDLLVGHGAPAPAGDWLEWVSLAVSSTTRPMRHHGTHRYVWGLNRSAGRALPEGRAYPKLELRAA